MGAPVRQLILLAMALVKPAMGSVAKQQEAAVATPTPEYEFISSPGMPLPESLGLTVAELFNKTWVGELFKDAHKSQLLRLIENPARQQLNWVHRPSLENTCDRDGHENEPENGIRVCATSFMR
ncbi:hypothetical protein MMYC01_210354 [Madurella mycetomatis]|uniref:Uncharacterized protein n=1 Tax=Madurella mycetomatis TaxID=100816 RepID=A0A175VQ69_9PEZI|nr:hypothetical protein MMYC01_210226 [Madurella mycetomatis]KXX73395.1 hypothetical protein MMYC01_210354 [Madurella mycetomatis]